MNSNIKNLKSTLYLSSLVTIIFSTAFQDPFNPIKVSLIYVMAAWGIGQIFINFSLLKKIIGLRIFFYSIIFFISAFLISSLKTDVVRTAFFGDTQRNNGFLFYFSLAVISLVVSLNINFESVTSIYKTIFGVAFIVSIYGIIQFQGYDFVKWNNPYNAIISTLGNPNFVSALSAIFAVLTFVFLWTRTSSKIFSIILLILLIGLLAIIYLSESRQGLISFSIGISTFIGILTLFSKKRILKYIYFSIFIPAIYFLITGMLNYGPLKSLVYKDSISVRGFYWRAGIEMFRENPLWGVGVDRYGGYFKQYREAEYSLRYGYDITSSNAHNTLIQFFSTAGFFVGASYLLILGIVVRRAITAIRISSGTKQVLTIGIFAAWIAFQSQSFISIDSPGLAIWGWVLGGALVGLSNDRINLQKSIPKQNLPKPSRTKTTIQPLVSGLSILIISVPVYFLFTAEIDTYKMRTVSNASNLPRNSAVLLQIAVKVTETPLVDPTYKLMAGNYIANNGFVTEGIAIIEDNLKSDQRCIDCRELLSIYYSQIGQLNRALELRSEISKLDPYNAKNLLAMVKLYQLLGNKGKVREFGEQILLMTNNSLIINETLEELRS